jgi:ankyrin repeat protein
MLKLGGDPNFGAGCGTTPLIMATRQADLAMVSALLKAGANPNVVGEGSCPLTMALRAKETELVTLLKKYHAKEVIMGPNGIMPKPAKP